MSHYEISDSAPSRDTGPLRLEQLSDHELATIIGIERHLFEAQEVKLRTTADNRSANCLAPVFDRYPRILLLDGARGTGKTSLLLTLADRWRRASHTPANWLEIYRTRVRHLQSNSIELTETDDDFQIPTHIVPVRILDFDSLPPEVPLVAGIVQAWRPLATHYDALARLNASYDDEQDALVDVWHRLFQVAAVGWAESRHKGGLIEQVLDREEQLDDWQRLDEQWREFVDDVITCGKRLKPPDQLSPNPVFVIMIDDVDLQVGRIRELLPSLRLLYHPHVVFIVAGDQRHLNSMLALDFLGQQNRLSDRYMVDDGVIAAETNAWALQLGQAAVQKTFPLANRWSLRPLSLAEVLKYPEPKDNFEMRLDVLRQQRLLPGARSEGLGSYLAQFARAVDEVSDLPPLMTYRTVQQVFRQTARIARRDVAGVAIQTLRYLIGGATADDVTRLTWRPSYILDRTSTRGDEIQKPVENVAAPRVATIDYRLNGEIAALYRADLSVAVSAQTEIILSARPEFIYRRTPSAVAEPMREEVDEVRNATAALIAISLREDNYPVAAPGLQWNVRLALAWTRVRMFDRIHQNPNLDLAFQWRSHEHPSPKRLLQWTTAWAPFIQKVHKNTEQQLERIAYAWIYYQLAAMGGSTNELAEPLADNFNSDKSWNMLLKQQPARGTPTEIKRWRTRTLALLARPEIGLSVDVQQRLLSALEKEPVDTIIELWDQRRRLVTDAILAAGDEGAAQTEHAEDQARVDYAISVFERRHKETFNSSSPWNEIVERRMPPTRKTKRNVSRISR